MAIIVCLIFLSLFLCIYFLLKEKFYYSSNIEGSYYFGTWQLLTQKDFRTVCENIFHNYGALYKMWIGPILFIGLKEPKYIEKIARNCLYKPNSLMEVYAGDGLVSIKSGKQWKHQRHILNPQFKLKTLRLHYDAMNRCCIENLIEDLKKHNSENIWYPLVNNSFSAVFKCFFNNRKTDSNFSHEYVDNILRISELWAFGLCTFKPLWFLSNNGKEFKEKCKIVKLIATELVDSACLDKLQQDSATSYINFLINDSRLPREEIIGNVQTFINIGVPSSVAAMIFAIILLAMHQKTQNALFEEITNLWSEDSNCIPYTLLNQANLLDRVLKETFRLFPIADLLRKTDKTIILDQNYTIPKGAFVFVDIFNLHRDATIWENPLTFDPDRFLPERFTTPQRSVYMPFWLPPRNCIGQSLATLFTKITIAHIIKHFKIGGCNYKNVPEIRLLFSSFVQPESCNLTFDLR